MLERRGKLCLPKMPRLNLFPGKLVTDIKWADDERAAVSTPAKPSSRKSESERGEG
jgi:hypothetical protein